MSVQTVGKDVCPNILKPLFGNFAGWNCNDGSQNPHRNDPPTPALARSLECLVGVPSNSASS